MGQPFVGQLLLTSFNFAPRFYALCNGQVFPINTNPQLFSLIGYAFGGDGQTRYALPNLQGKTPVCFGNGIGMGQSGGTEGYALTQADVPSHSHSLSASKSAASLTRPDSAMLAGLGTAIYAGPTPGTLASMAQATVATNGSSQAHENRQPYLVLTWSIALTGIYPSRP